MKIFHLLAALVFGPVLWGIGTGAAWGVEKETFETRVQTALEADDATAAASQLAALAAEALQAGRLDLQFHALAARSRALTRAGDTSLAGRELGEAIALARQTGQAAGEAELSEALAEWRLASGESLTAATWFERAWTLALSATPPDELTAHRALARLAQLRRTLGQEHLARQAEAWLALAADDPAAPEPEVSLQPLATTTQVASHEVARARLYLANATLSPVTGTLLLDGGDLVLGEWTSSGAGETATFVFPASASGAATASVPQGRRLTLRPGEIRVVTLEVEPNTPPRLARRGITATWQSGAQRQTATAQFLFERARDLDGTTAANASHVRLSPLLTVPVYMEVYHRGDPPASVQDLLPSTSLPCRVELYEVTSDAAGRKLLAVDADGDGRFDTLTDAVLADRDDSGYPDVSFASGKSVAALELHLYPLPAANGVLPPQFDLTVTLRDGAHWRHPADVRHRVENAPSSALPKP